MHRLLSTFSSSPLLLVALLLARCDAAVFSAPSMCGSLNQSLEFAMSCRQNETGHIITNFSLKESASELPKNWRTVVKYNVSDDGGGQTFVLRGDVVAYPPVPDDYQLFPGVGYYKFHQTEAVFDEAYRICAAEGGHLAVTNSDAESGVMATLFKANKKHKLSAWIGFDDRLVEGDFVTIFGDPLASTGFNKWKPGEPNGGRESNCGCVEIDGLLNDGNCESELPFVCEYDLSWADV